MAISARHLPTRAALSSVRPSKGSHASGGRSKAAQAMGRGARQPRHFWKVHRGAARAALLRDSVSAPTMALVSTTSQPMEAADLNRLTTHWHRGQFPVGRPDPPNVSRPSPGTLTAGRSGRTARQLVVIQQSASSKCSSTGSFSSAIAMGRGYMELAGGPDRLPADPQFEASAPRELRSSVSSSFLDDDAWPRP